MGCLFRDYDAVTQAPTSLTMNSQHMRRLERFTVLMYSKNCESESVNEAIYSTHYFNMQSVRCSLPHLYGNSLLSKNPEIPKPGWEWNNRTMAWVPYWTDLPDASHGCSILLHCGCSVTCKGNCKGFRAGIWCSQLCKCDGGCTNNVTWSWTVNRMYQELFLVFRIFPNLKRISSCSLYFAS